MENFKIVVADHTHLNFVETICKEIQLAQRSGSMIAVRIPEDIERAITAGNAIIALTSDNGFAGFSYLKAWEDGRFVSHSGLIVSKPHRKFGLAMDIKKYLVSLSKSKYPNADLFGITTSLAVMKINGSMGYKPVTFQEITHDESFWQGCTGCPNHSTLKRTDGRLCLCTAMKLTANT
jgi:hypothetical protein